MADSPVTKKSEGISNKNTDGINEVNICQKCLTFMYELEQKKQNGMTAEILKHLINAMEDRRIDNLTFMANVGYRDYYHKLYEHFFFTDEMKKMLDNDEKLSRLKGKNINTDFLNLF